jgi:hypothetical protein
MCLLAASASAQTLSGDRVELLSGPCVISSGSGAPSGGNTCDAYIDTTTGDLYTKRSGTWTVLPRLEVANIFTAAQSVSTTEPAYYFLETDQGTNLKNTRLDMENGVLQVQTLTDAFSVSATIATLSRAGALAISAGFSATTGNFTSTLAASGLIIPAVGVRLPNNVYIIGRNAASASRNLIGIDGSDIVQIAQSGDITNVGGKTTFASNVAVGVANVNSLVAINATLSGNTGNGTGFNIGAVLTPAPGFLGRGMVVAPFLNEAASGIHALMSGATFSNVNGIAAGAATVTDTANVYIDGAYSATVSGGNYALWVDDGITRLDGAVTVGGTGTFAADILPSLGYTSNLGSLSKKFLQAHIAELVVETLVAQSTMATIGGRILVAPTNVFLIDIAAAATSITVKYNNLESGARIYSESSGKVEWFAVTNAGCAAAASPPYTCTVTRNLDGSGANDWFAGDAVLNTGTTGNGFIDLYSTAGVLSGTGPTIVGNVRTGTTYNNIAARWAIGNLDGLYGVSGSLYGVALGDATAANMLIDATNGIRIRVGTTNYATLSATTFTIGAPGGNRVAWDGTDLTVVSELLSINSDGLTIGDGSPITVFSSPASLKFARRSGLGFGQTGDIFGLYPIVDVAGTSILNLTNKVIGNTTTDGEAFTGIAAIGWDKDSGSGVPLASALIGLSSASTGVKVEVTAPTINLISTTETKSYGSSFRTGYTADATAYTQTNANLLAGDNGEAVGIAGSTSLANINLYLKGVAQRKATIQAVGGVGASNNGGRLAIFTKDDAASGTDVVQAGYFDFSTGGAGGGFVMGAPTGGSKGAGTINVAGDIYKNNTAYTNPKWALQRFFTGTADASGPYEVPAWYEGLRSLEEHRAFVSQHYDLPLMLQEQGAGMFRRGDLLLASVEEAYLYIYQLSDRLAALKAEVSRLKGGKQ